MAEVFVAISHGEVSPLLLLTLSIHICPTYKWRHTDLFKWQTKVSEQCPVHREVVDLRGRRPLNATLLEHLSVTSQMLTITTTAAHYCTPNATLVWAPSPSGHTAGQFQLTTLLPVSLGSAN